MRSTSVKATSVMTLVNDMGHSSHDLSGKLGISPSSINRIVRDGTCSRPVEYAAANYLELIRAKSTANRIIDNPVQLDLVEPPAAPQGEVYLVAVTPDKKERVLKVLAVLGVDVTDI